MRTVWLQVMKETSLANRFVKMRAGWREACWRETSLSFQSRQVKYAVSPGQRGCALSCKDELSRASWVFVAHVQTSVAEHQSVTTSPPLSCFPTFHQRFCYIHHFFHPDRVGFDLQPCVCLSVTLLEPCLSATTYNNSPTERRGYEKSEATFVPFG